MKKNFCKRLMIIVSAIVLMVSVVKADQKYVEVVPNATSEEEILMICDTLPEFTGGMREMYNYLSENLMYPVQAQRDAIQGRVTVRFVVTKTGEIRDVKVLRSVDPLLDAEALRVVKAMPNWIPGRQYGRAVNVYFNLPVVFKLSK